MIRFVVFITCQGEHAHLGKGQKIHQDAVVFFLLLIEENYTSLVPQ